MCKIVGYHLPITANRHRDVIRSRFSVGPSQKFLTFERKMYSRHLHAEEEKKQERFEKVDNRNGYVTEVIKGTTLLIVQARATSKLRLIPSESKMVPLNCKHVKYLKTWRGHSTRGSIGAMSKGIKADLEKWW